MKIDSRQRDRETGPGWINPWGKGVEVMSRFHIDELEERIAPSACSLGTILGGLLGGVDAAVNAHVSTDTSTCGGTSMSGSTGSSASSCGCGLLGLNANIAADAHHATVNADIGGLSVNAKVGLDLGGLLCSI
jgi:hypothetical protein